MRPASCLPPLPTDNVVRAEGLLETVLYAGDLDAAEQFYADVMGLPLTSRFDDGIVFRCGDGVLIVFDPESTRASDRDIPPHGAVGEGHVAFTMPPEEADAWRRHLDRCAVPIEAEVAWNAGPSLYFRDPSGNLVELAPPTLWGFTPSRPTKPPAS